MPVDLSSGGKYSADGSMVTVEPLSTISTSMSANVVSQGPSSFFPSFILDKNDVTARYIKVSSYTIT